jgi:hypothetical protein
MLQLEKGYDRAGEAEHVGLLDQRWAAPAIRIAAIALCTMFWTAVVIAILD